MIVTAPEHGPAAAIRVALAWFTDTPVILLALVVLTNVSDGVFAALSLVGGVYLIGLGLPELRAASRPVWVGQRPPRAGALDRRPALRVLGWRT